MFSNKYLTSITYFLIQLIVIFLVNQHQLLNLLLTIQDLISFIEKEKQNNVNIFYSTIFSILTFLTKPYLFINAYC